MNQLDQKDKGTMTNLNRRRFLSIATTLTGGIGILFASIPFISSFQPSKKAKALATAVKVNLNKLEPGSITVSYTHLPLPTIYSV